MKIKPEVYVGGFRQKFIDGSAPAPEYLEAVFSLVNSAAEAEEVLGIEELDTPKESP